MIILALTLTAWAIFRKYAARPRRSYTPAAYTAPAMLSPAEIDRRAKAAEKAEKQQQREAAEVQKLYYKIEKATDEAEKAAHDLEEYAAQRDALQAELDSITQRLTVAGSGVLDPLEIVTDKRKRDLYDGESGAELFMEQYAQAIGEDQTKKAADRSKMLKRQETITNKLRNLENKIFTAEQKAKKAAFEKYAAQQRLAALGQPVE